MAVLPVAEVAESALDAVAQLVADRFACATRRLPALPVPAEAHDRRRGQDDATTVLRAALGARPADALRLVAVTERDLFIPMLTFVFGQAQLDGPAALVSLARLRQEFHGLPPRPDLLRDRLRKEVLHELGHTFGLVHCTDRRCAMALSVGVAGIDIKRDALCDDCAVRLDDRLRAVRPVTGATEE